MRLESPGMGSCPPAVETVLPPARAAGKGKRHLRHPPSRSLAHARRASGAAVRVRDGLSAFGSAGEQAGAAGRGLGLAVAGGTVALAAPVGGRAGRRGRRARGRAGGRARRPGTVAGLGERTAFVAGDGGVLRRGGAGSDGRAPPGDDLCDIPVSDCSLLTWNGMEPPGMACATSENIRHVPLGKPTGVAIRAGSVLAAGRCRAVGRQH